MGRWGAGEQSAKRGGKRRWGGREAREEEEAVRNLGIERFRKRIRNRRGSNIDRRMKRAGEKERGKDESKEEGSLARVSKKEILRIVPPTFD